MSEGLFCCFSPIDLLIACRQNSEIDSSREKRNRSHNKFSSRENCLEETLRDVGHVVIRLGLF